MQHGTGVPAETLAVEGSAALGLRGGTTTPKSGGQPETEALGAEAVNSVLLDRYLEVLDPDALVHIARTERRGALSRLFVPAVDDTYLQSHVRVMLVGKEPRGWRGTLQAWAASEQSRDTLRDDLVAGMRRHRAQSASRHGTSKFLQFRAELGARLEEHVGTDNSAIFWTNALCVSLNTRSPATACNFKRLLVLSQHLLRIQLDELQPDVVLFSTGYGYDDYIKPLVPERTRLDGFVAKRFWPFKTPAFTAYRFRHPQVHTRTEREDVIGTVRARIDAIARTRIVNGKP